MPDTTEKAELHTFSERVHEFEVGRCRVQMLPTDVSEVISCRGSFNAYPDFAGGDELRQELAVSLLDKGTRRRDRFELAAVLEERGARLNIDSDGLRVEFSIRSLRKDLPEVLAVLAEMFTEPAFDPVEFEKARAHLAGSLQRELEDTGAQASGALARALFDESHPNYTPDPRTLLTELQSLTVDQVEAYHARHFGATDFLLAVAGDVDPDETARWVQESLGSWPESDAEPSHSTEAQRGNGGEAIVPMPDKSNIDVYMGHALSLRRQDEDYIPLYLGNYVLGGNFSARLMTVVRDERGLTYGIGSGLSGISTEYDGHWNVNVTLSQEKLEEGLRVTREVIERFVREGITEEELAEKKTTITGSFKVGLASSSRLAQALLNNAERGFPVDYLDRFPAEVEGLTLAEVNGAIEKHLDPDRLFTAMAGDVPSEAKQGV